MKITESQLRKLIVEELFNDLMLEQPEDDAEVGSALSTDEEAEEGEEGEEDEEELDLPEDEPLSGVETIDLDIYELLGDEDPNDLDASEIITYIESYGGVLNQEMKKKELL